MTSDNGGYSGQTELTGEWWTERKQDKRATGGKRWISTTCHCNIASNGNGIRSSAVLYLLFAPPLPALLYYRLIVQFGAGLVESRKWQQQT